MAFDLVGKAVKNLRLPTVNYNNSLVKIIPAQQGDTNSRYFSITMFDDRGDIDFTNYNEVTLNAMLPDGTMQYAVGEIDKENNVAVCKIVNSMLKQIGKVSCDILLVGTDANGKEVALTSQTFYVLSAKSNTGDGSVPGEDEESLLVQLLKDIGELKNDVTNLQNDTTALRKDVDSVTQQATTLDKSLKALQNNVTNIDSDVSQSKTDISDLKESVAMAETNITDLGNDIDKINEDIGDGKHGLSALDKRVDGLEEDVFSETKIMGDYHIVDVPESSKIAKINSLGGRTYKSENLIKFPYIDMPSGAGSVERNGITWTVNEDGTVVANGKATGLSRFDISSKIRIRNKHISGCPKGGGYSSFYIGTSQHDDVGDGWYFDERYTEDSVFIAIFIVDGYTANNVVFYPMLNEGSVAKPYSQWFSGLRDTKTTGVKPISKNMINCVVNKNDDIGSDFLIHLNAGSYILTLFNEDGTTEGIVPGGTFAAQFRNISDEILIENVHSGVVITEEQAKQIAKIRIYYASSQYTGTSSKLYFYFGKNIDVSYTPYIDLPTLPIPAEVQAMEGYGKGVEAVDGTMLANTVDFVNKIYIYKAKELILKGTENWAQTGVTTDEVRGYAIESKLLNALSKDVKMRCDDFVYADERAPYVPNSCSQSNGVFGIRFVVSKKIVPNGTLEEWKAYLAQRLADGSPLKIVYAINPEETDISQYFPNGADLPVEAHGSVVFENEENKPIPVDVSMYATRKPLDILQTTGTRTDAPMSQDAMTKEINRIDNDINKLGELSVKIETWKDVQKAVRLGLAKKYIHVGDIFTSKYKLADTSYDIPWHVCDIKDVVTPEGVKEAAIIQMHKMLPTSVQFDNHEAFYKAKTQELPAGTYHVVIADNWGTYHKAGDTYSFTLSKPLPVGGVLTGFENTPYSGFDGMKIRSYAKLEDTTPIEEVVPTKSAEGTKLGDLTFKGSENFNGFQQVCYGYNRFLQSYLRQWLNNSGKGFWKAQNEFDRPPADYQNVDGFMTGFDAEFLGVLGKFKSTTAKNYVYDDGKLEDTFDMFAPPSLEQMYIKKQVAGEGEAFSYWKEALGLPEPREWYKETPELVHMDMNNSARYTWLRSAGAHNSYAPWYVYPSGYVSNGGGARNSFCVAPLAAIY